MAEIDPERVAALAKEAPHVARVGEVAAVERTRSVLEVWALLPSARRAGAMAEGEASRLGGC